MSTEAEKKRLRVVMGHLKHARVGLVKMCDTESAFHAEKLVQEAMELVDSAYREGQTDVEDDPNDNTAFRKDGR